MNQEQDENRVNWRRVQISVTVRAILIVLGALLMQMVSLVICLTVAAVIAFVGSNGSKKELLGIFDGYLQNQELLNWASLVNAAIVGIWCGTLYRRSDWREERMDYRKAFSPGNLLSIFGIGAGGCILLSVLLSIVAAIVPEAFNSYNQVMEALTGSGAIVNVLYVLFVGPVSEELVFRGAVFDRFYLAFPFFMANILQAALFGLYHMNLIQGLYAFLLGVSLGLVRRATGSILGSILVHIIFNSTSWLLDMLLPETVPNWAYFLLAVLAGVCCAVGLMHMRGEVRRRLSSENTLAK